MTGGRPPPRTPFADRSSSAAAGWLGVRLFLVSLAILFSVPLIGYWAIRLAPAAVGGADVSIPPLPRGLWGSTLILLGASAAIHFALAAARRGRRGVAAWTSATLLLGVAFLVVQAACWLAWMEDFRRSVPGADRAFVLTSFYVLTGLHAIHVIGGLIPLGVATRRAIAGSYTPDDYAGLRFCALYWHFLDAVWLAVFLTLMLGSWR